MPKDDLSDIWKSALLVPLYFVALSLLAISVECIALSKPARILSSKFSPPRSPLFTNADHEESENEGVASDFKAHIRSFGDTTIFFYRFARFLGCISLVGLTIFTAVVGDSGTDFGAWKKGGSKKSKKYGWPFSKQETLNLAVCLSYTYASLLAIIAISATRPWRDVANKHLVILLLATFCTFGYRDLWPLATYTESPADASEGFIWIVKMVTLSIIAVFIPLFVPRPYIPLDPKAPSPVPNPEQTASLISFSLFFFLDDLIWKAYYVAHLAHDQLPPLADYDYAANLVKRSFKHLDPFSGAKKEYIFFGLLRVFKQEYIEIAIMSILSVVSNFARPVGINRLLDYIEKEQRGETDHWINPWVWIVFLFIGPSLGSVVFQRYIFLTTGTLVRTEGILTQLVFEHALRIRMKASTSKTSGNASGAITPDTASIAESSGSATGGLEGEQAGGSGSEDTGREGTSTVDQTKGKAKVPSETSATPSKASSPASKSEGSNLVGRLNNLVTSDLSNITDARDFCLLIIYTPVMIGLGLWFLYDILGWSAFVGMGAMVLGLPLPAYVASVIQSVQQERMKWSDDRVQYATETMGIARMIKLFGWEPKVCAVLAEKREQELKWIKRRQWLDLVNGTLNFILPLVTMLVTYVTFTVVMKRQLSASIVFSSMAVFDIIRDQLHGIFYYIPASIQGKVSLDRFSEFLSDSELLDHFADSKNAGYIETIASSAGKQDTIGFNDATFTWSAESDGTLTPSRRLFKLRIENEVVFQKGKINLIVGPTGSGKTSLLMALLGEMHFVPEGPESWYNLPRQGGVAYAAQESWVQNETIKDNILFGAPFDEIRYKKVLHQCALERDLSLFEAGDRTEVGEKGLTLSGGQKARITLARAVYSKAQILLLDDVLAALDVHTATWIVEKCFQGDLIQGRTVLLVTHNVAIGSEIADSVLSLGLDGRVKGHGTVDEVLKVDKRLRAKAETGREALEKATAEEVDPEAKTQKSSGKLTVEEEIAEGHVSWAALKLYFKEQGGISFWMVFIFMLLVCEVAASLSTWYLGYWASQYETKNPDEVNIAYYLTVYSIILLLNVAGFSIGYVVYVFGAIRASREIHRKLVESVIGTTLRWLDTTPTGRIIARCTQDIRTIDGPFAMTLFSFAELSFSMIIRLAAVILFTPVFIFPGILVGLLGGWCGQIYIKAQLSVKREMSNARSPVLSHFGAAMAGLVSIRAYGAQEAFRTESLKRIDRYTRSARMFYNLNRWICIRIDALGGLFASGLAGYLLYVSDLNSSSNTGFSLTMAVAFSSMILWWVRMMNEFEVNGNSLERIQGYLTIEQEPKPTTYGKPPAYWPSSGDLRVENLSARYSPDGPVVLHNLNFHIKSGERIGVVGRTGSGKSSLTLSLLRCLYTDGTVYYDNIPTAAINLDSLRRNITIIPQVPELLSGTLRYNLDPFGEHDDATLNNSLRSAGLFSLQTDDDENTITLESEIASGGNNLSVGQRQILALARAIVRGSKVFILDEATSAIDYATDSIIQNSLRNELGKDVTLITIAHRLQTIMDADRIMVLDAGEIVEFDSPKELLKVENGKLRSLVDESVDKETLHSMANSLARHQEVITLG